jgi:SAM-dependent methyltransferase
VNEVALPPSDSTFRDPAGSVTLTPDAVLRTVVREHTPETLDFLASPLAHALTSAGDLIPSRVLANTGDGLLLEHPRVPFISYPSEWPPSLWLAAANLTLDLCIQLVGEGWILKDATPLNVLFTGTKPIFVDLLSIRRTEPKPIWFAYGQFVRTFLLPLLAHQKLGWRLQTAQTWRDGIEPEELYAALSWPRRLAYPARSFITLPVVLSKLMKSNPSSLPKPQPREPEFIRETLLKTLASLKSAMQTLEPGRRASTWSHYAETAGHYSGDDHAEKRAFVTEALAQAAPKNVLDVGSNTGNYSRLAAATGANVVAIDQDTGALERLYAQSRASGDNILPLCVDLAFPTPATGWQNRESFSFLARCENHFDMVLMLAVIHHLLLSAQIPLDRIAELAARITTRTLILEWVPPTDPKFIEVLRGRESIYTHITEQAFREAFAPHFTIVREATLNNGRILFHMVKR